MRVPVLLFFLAICVLFSACESRDAKWRKAMVGSWKADQTAPGVNIVGALTLGADGTMHEDLFITANHWKGPLIYNGTWKVEDGDFLLTIDKSSVAKLMPKERTNRRKILNVTDRELTLQESKTGKTFVQARVQ